MIHMWDKKLAKPKILANEEKTSNFYLIDSASFKQRNKVFNWVH